MRRLVGTAALTALLVVIPPALGHPGHGPAEVRVGDDFFRPDSPTVATGDSVVWKWTGPAGNHSVTADAGQQESFDSDPGKQASEIEHTTGYVFAHTFTHVGRFTYYCRVHPAMRGAVEVIALPPPDVTRPKLTGVSLSPRRVATRAYLRLTASEAATVVGRIDRRTRGGWRVTRTFYFRAPKGRLRRRVRVQGLAPGPYRLRLVAYDNASNSSPTSKLRFRMLSQLASITARSPLEPSRVGSRRLALLHHVALGEREQQRDRGEHQQDRRAEDDDQPGEGVARAGGLGDVERLGEQVGVLRHAPAPDHGHDRPDGERPRAAGRPSA